MTESRRARPRGRDELDVQLDASLSEEVFPRDDDERVFAGGELPEWLDPVVRVVLEEARSLAALELLVRDFDLSPETLLAEGIAREVRREMSRRTPPKKARRESDHVDAGLWSTLQLVNAYIEASEAALAARSRGRDASVQAAFDVLSAFSMPGRMEAPEIDLSGPFDACVKNSERIWDAHSGPRTGRFQHMAFALEMAREHGCLVPPGATRGVMETLRAAARRYESSQRLDPWVQREEMARSIVRRRMGAHRKR